MSTVALTIAIQRLASMLVGAFCLWLAYKLFHVNNEQQGCFEGNGFGVSFKLRKVAPGVFFGLFGAAIVLYSVRPIGYTLKDGTREEIVAATAKQVQPAASVARTAKPQRVERWREEQLAGAAKPKGAK